MTLIEFLTARLDEDEQIARKAGEGIYSSWSYDKNDASSCGEVFIRDPGEPGIRAAGAFVAMVTCDSDGGPAVEPEQATHIARHDPARILREVAAKRDLIAEFADRDCISCRSLSGGGLIAQTVFSHLAAPYSDHPDYDAAWSE